VGYNILRGIKMKGKRYFYRLVLCWFALCLFAIDARQAIGENVVSLPQTLTKFDASRAGTKVEISGKANQHRVYIFYLYLYYRDPEDRRRLVKLVGDGSRYPDGRYGNPGLVIPVHIKITDSTGIVIKDVTRDTQGIDVHGFIDRDSGYYSRYIYSIELKPGIYRMEIGTVKDMPQFSGRSCAIHIGWHPNTGPISN
jgi:hypothetical protein